VAALRSMARRGRERLEQGFWVVVFPEGTRVAPGERRDYQTGGAWLASRTTALVVPVALNSGQVWPRNAFLKRPGTITVSIGAALDSRGQSAEDINRQVKDWIESEVARLDAGTDRR
ncbi:MAG TPA: lysophospholipid acyltransferase family protein, partial [Burkholderiales bacterium]|nr:lysophospholipid acyltransferase family protein [Burkholderiales bacterium]